MSESADAIPERAPGPMVAAALLGGAVVLLDLLALLLILPFPLVLLLAPLLVPGDRIDLGLWLIDTPGEAWLAAVPGAILMVAIAVVAAKAARRQRAWVIDQVTPVRPVESTPPKAPPGLIHLTERETQVLELMSQGFKNAAIAVELVISEATVRKHVGRIFAKLDLDADGHDRRVTAVLTHLRNSAPPSQLDR